MLPCISRKTICKPGHGTIARDQSPARVKAALDHRGCLAQGQGPAAPARKEHPALDPRKVAPARRERPASDQGKVAPARRERPALDPGKVAPV